MKSKTVLAKNSLFNEIRNYIEEGRQQLSVVANATITYTYWRIGNRINQEILKNQRAAYGKKIVVSLSRQLTGQYGVSYEEKNLRRMMQFAMVYHDEKIVVSLTRQLSWSHIITFLPLKNELQREFYTQMSIVEGWSIKILRQKIDGLLFERTAISKKPDRLIKKERRLLVNQNTLLLILYLKILIF